MLIFPHEARDFWWRFWEHVSFGENPCVVWRVEIRNRVEGSMNLKHTEQPPCVKADTDC